MSQAVSVAVPTLPNAFSAQLDTGVIDPSSVVGRLSQGLSQGDQLAIYGSLDPASTGGSRNLTYIADIRGSSGELAPSPQIGGWRYLFLKRLPTSAAFNAGAFYASGNDAPAPATASASVVVPASGIVGLSLQPFQAPVRLTLGENFTSADVFDVYATDDPTTTDLRGTTLIGQIRGGGSALPLGSGTSSVPGRANQPGPGAAAPNALFIAYTRVMIQRVEGTTSGSVFAWGATPAAAVTASMPTVTNKSMAASTTVADNDLACATAVTGQPKGWIGVEVNGVGYDPGNGTKLGVPCYFSGDGGATARAQGAVQAGDRLYWVGSAAGFQLAAATDTIDFLFNI